MRDQDTDPNEMEYWEGASLHCGWIGLSEGRPAEERDTAPAFAFLPGGVPDCAAAQA
jgi:hypothetical protein